VGAYQEYEDNLLRAAKDVNDEASYAAFYKQHGQAREALGWSPEDVLPRDPTVRGILTITAIIVCGILLLMLAGRMRRRRKLATGGAAPA
jgi:hypothetical protein